MSQYDLKINVGHSDWPCFSYFPTLLCTPYFSKFVFENALLFLLFSPKMFEVTKIIIFFHARCTHWEFVKNSNQPNLSSCMQKFIKYFYVGCNSFFGTFTLAFPFHGNGMLLFRENTVCLLYLFLSLKTRRMSLLSYFS